VKPVTLFLDRCLGGRRLARLLREDGWGVELHDDHFGQATSDVEWLPVVAERGWLVLTEDLAIFSDPDERFAVAAHRARVILLASHNLTTQAVHGAVSKASAAILAMAEREGPFANKLYRDGRLEPWWSAEQLLAGRRG
jgi:predicted nuclease of predicted toxin-antitoxin system